jgi:amino acid permease
LESLTDTFPKTGFSLTAVNIIKSFIGLGILAGPYGYATCGFIPATLLIIFNASLNVLTINFQTRCKETLPNGHRIKTFGDLGEACFGRKGRIWFSLAIFLNQVMCCIGYVIFFMEQIGQVMNPIEGEAKYDQRTLLCITLVILVPMSVYFESMKQLSYLSMIALASISSALVYLFLTDV